MTVIAIHFGNCGIVETVDAMPRDPAKPESVLVILATKPLVVIQLFRKMDFVTSPTENVRLMKRFEEGLFVKLWLCFDELPVHPLKHCIVTECKWIVWRLIDCVISISSGRVHMRDAMA